MIAMTPSSPTARASLLTAVGVTLPFVVLALLTANPALTLLGVLVLALVVVLLHRSGEPPALLFVCAMQWLQAIAKVLHANALGVKLDMLPAAHHLGIAAADTIERSAALSLGWVAAVALGMRLALWNVPVRPARDAPLPDAVMVPRLLVVYLGWTASMFALGGFARGGVQQLIGAIADLRWAVVYVLFWVTLRQPRQRLWLLPVFFVEVAAGFLSFFATFRMPVFLLALAVGAGTVRVRARHLAGFVAVAALALYLGVVWSAIKGEYRTVLNRGTGEQIVDVGRGAQVAELARLFGTVDRTVLEGGLERLVDRVGYIDYFAYSLEHVPALRPHENGRLWRQAVGHVLQPRLFFPGKAELESDTRVAERYTGLDLMSWTETTSVALGMHAEAYVDFGLPWMFVAAVWIGLLCGWLQRAIGRAGRDTLFRDGLLVAMLLPLAGLEPSTTKFFGGYVTRMLVGWVLWKALLQRAAIWVRTRESVATASDVTVSSLTRAARLSRDAR
jgi:hypothetical protein